MFADAFEDILAAHCDPGAVRAIEEGGPWQNLWDVLAKSGFLELLAPEDRGGAKLPLSELHPLLAALGRHAMPLPVAQSICARAIVASSLPVGPITMAPALVNGPGGSACCPRTPFGMLAQWVLVPERETILLIPTEGAHRERCGDSHMATLSWAGLEGARHIEGSPESLHAMSAALHASVMAGAMERVLDMTLQYCNERQQFGRALGKFQAVQHQLSVMAEHVTAVSVAAQAAFHTAAPSPEPILAAMAKARASRAAPLIANAAHALHGAIGVTKEFDLQLFTRLLHAWRAAHGSESHWDGIVGRSLLASGQTMADFARTCGEAHAPEAA